ncbi:unnamed protein product [Acanthoscelides obtectus]|uniref:PiggyBac transposable element-derived protein domain-containing protein n=1 Tax=Acanthoscelides obtectus TaxID=200917 RepID=A0A9P0KFL0_ACAOB|nr:unnamed protein product [Acanthoscelides obtectus]CAK1680369.1 PiggyBac transposable element-derived protein 4 [Acanthoscelides obtectus]
MQFLNYVTFLSTERYAHNFYSGIPLVKTLLDQKCLSCGTLRPNRKGVPKEFTKKNKKGVVIGREKSKIKIIKWLDKRPVFMITTHPAHNATLEKKRKEEDILKPQCVIDYNLAKNGVDFSDQMSSYHTVVRKWYRKVMFELLLGTTVVNSWIVYNMVSDTKLSIMEFRTQLAKDLVIEQAEVPKQPVSSRKRQHTFVKPEGPRKKEEKTMYWMLQKIANNYNQSRG